MGRHEPILIHYRRCHVCGAVTEREVKIERCDTCGKSVVPFFFFDDTKVPPPEDRQLKKRFEGEMRPVLGLTAYWGADEAPPGKNPA